MVANSWNGVSLCASRVGAKFPQLVAAQWALESGYGKHFSGTWNAFGLKGAGSVKETKEFLDGQWVTIKDGFIDFPTLEASIEYLVSRWYKDWGGYKGVNNAASEEEAARMLQSEGYATDPEYPQKLIRLMKENTKRRPIKLTSAAKYFRGESHQIAAWNYLEDCLTSTELDEFALLYRSGPDPQILTPKNPLDVPYFSQRDNLSGTGYRECFSSSCAMLAAFYGRVTSDDEYNTIRQRYGDTTSSQAHVEALRSLGLKTRFSTEVTEKMLTDELRNGKPVAVGWLHYGAYNEPTGGGHWSVVIGDTDEDFIHHDPFGEADMVNGSFLNAVGGQNVRYSKRCWIPRWRVGGSGGWAIFASP